MPSLHLLPLVAWDEVFKALQPKVHGGRTPRAIEGGEILRDPMKYREIPGGLCKV